VRKLCGNWEIRCGNCVWLDKTLHFVARGPQIFSFRRGWTNPAQLRAARSAHVSQVLAAADRQGMLPVHDAINGPSKRQRGLGDGTAVAEPEHDEPREQRTGNPAVAGAMAALLAPLP